jgi:hypothetical protein
MKPTIAIFIHDPQCETDCALAMIQGLLPDFEIRTFGIDELDLDFLHMHDVVAFPGGMGDSDDFHVIFDEIQIEMVQTYVAEGGKYLGICMGAYWAGPQYFDLCIDLEIEQYIKQPTADIITDGPTVANVTYNGVLERMYFYDGCAILGDSIDTVVATYANGDAMAAIQGNVGMFGCHPEALEWWYTQGGMDIALYDTTHAVLMCLFVHQLLDS